MNIVRLDARHYEAVMRLFLDCFENDHYYKDLLPDDSTRREELRALSDCPVMFCLDQGMCVGIFDPDDSNALIAFILCFDYSACRSCQKEMIFGPDSPVHPYLSGMDRIMFELSIAVRPDYRRRGLASALVDKMLTDYPECTMVSDVSNTESLPIYEKRDFKITPLGPDYNLVVHKGAQ